MSTSTHGQGEEDDGAWHVGPSCQEDRGGSSIPGGAEEDVDPLDAFMAEITQIQELQEKEAQRQSQRSVERKERDLPYEDEESVEVDAEYLLKARQKAGLESTGFYPQAGTRAAAHDMDMDSDEEVYATARAIDRDRENEVSFRKGPKNLPAFSRIQQRQDKQEYGGFVRLSYCPPPELASLDGAAVAARRRALNVKTSPADAHQAPIERFEQCGFDEPLLSAISDAGFVTPTPIQAQALPVVLSGRDVLGIAQTGSGKTAAYVLPMIVHVIKNRKHVVRTKSKPTSSFNSLLALVLSPTRELAEQIHRETRRFGSGRPYGIKVVAAFGGLDKYQQIKEVRGGAEIAVGTPGRMLDLSKEKGCGLLNVSYLVLDEADRMLDMGFEPQIRSLLGQIRPDRHTVMFSATMPRKMQRLAADFLDPSKVQITIGTGRQVNQDIQQTVVVLEDEQSKRRWLESNISNIVDQGDVLIFVNRRDRVEELTVWLASSAGVRVAGLHGDMPQTERMHVLAGLGEGLEGNSGGVGKLHVVVATDVAARGLDIHSIKTVINYDPPKDSDTYVHRVGRTGRAGDTEGSAVTLLLPTETKAAADLIRCFENSRLDPWLDPRVYDIAGRTRTPRSHTRAHETRAHGSGGHTSKNKRPASFRHFVPASNSQQLSTNQTGQKPSVVVVMPKMSAQDDLRTTNMVTSSGPLGAPHEATNQATNEAIQRARSIAARLSGEAKKARFA